ncbi:MAG: hypothetical protein WA695_03715 [Candidatus Dormiibacterota bacterium]
MRLPTFAVMGTIGLAAIAVLAAIPGASAAGSGWHVGNYDPSGKTLSLGEASAPASGVATFNFTQQSSTCSPATSYTACGDLGAGTALLITDQGSNKSGLTGNDSEMNINANFTISNLSGTGAFTYGGEPYCGGSASVRLYFESTHGPFGYSNYWWSDTGFVNLVANGTFTLTAQIDPTLAAWGNWDGQPSAANTAAFTAAASDVTAIGLSFGGGCFFENGVGTTDGSGTFTLNSFSVS